MKETLTILALFCVLKSCIHLTTVRHQDDVTVEVINRRQLRGTIGRMLPLSSTRTRRRAIEAEPVRFAWGIISHPDDEDIRNVLRKTYLASDSRICILQDSGSLPAGCQIAYTFVLPSSLLEDHEAVTPIVSDAKDVTYLPEAPERSLLSTWFRYASRTEVDYVAKVDATTLLFPNKFLEVSQELLSSPDLHRVIGGIPRDRWDCGGFSRWKCRQMTGRTYMSTELYFMSTDLAALVPLDVSDEDPLRISNWLSSSLPQLPTIQVTIQPTHCLWESEPSTIPSSELLERWQFLESQQFSRKLLRLNISPAPRWRGKSLLDEFYRRIPWKYIPNTLTRFNLP